MSCKLLSGANPESGSHQADRLPREGKLLGDFRQLRSGLSSRSPQTGDQGSSFFNLLNQDRVVLGCSESS